MLRKDSICKNCGYYVANEKFCGQCGQKTDTHRLTWKHFISHDIVHGLFHFEGLVPKTIWSIIKNPAKVAVEYIEGKRKSYYSFFYLLLILIGVYLVISPSPSEENLKMFDDDGMVLVKGVLWKYSKIFVFSLVPIISLSGFLIFRKAKYNFVEHNILAVCSLIGSYILFILFIIFDFFVIKILDNENFSSDSLAFNLFSIIGILVYVASLFYPMFSYFQFSKMLGYTILGSIWRVIFFYILSLILLLILAILIASIFRGELTKGFLFF